MKELLLEYLSDMNIFDLTFKRSEYKGNDGYEVMLRLDDSVDTEHRFWFSKINRMGAEHMAAVIRSYIHIDNQRLDVP